MANPSPEQRSAGAPTEAAGNSGWEALPALMPALCAFARQETGDPTLAEDIVNSALLEVLARGLCLTDLSFPKAYLKGLIRWRARDANRKARRQVRLCLDSADELAHIVARDEVSADEAHAARPSLLESFSSPQREYVEVLLDSDYADVKGKRWIGTWNRALRASGYLGPTEPDIPASSAYRHRAAIWKRLRALRGDDHV